MRYLRSWLPCCLVLCCLLPGAAQPDAAKPDAALLALATETDLPRLLQYTADPRPDFRLHALQRLAQLRAPEAAEAFVKALADAPPDARAVAARGLGFVPSERPTPAITALITALKDDNAEVRAAATAALGRRRAVAAVDPLLAGISDTTLRDANPVDALQQIGEPAAIGLAHAIVRERDKTKLANLLTVFSRFQPTVTVEPLLALVQTEGYTDIALAPFSQIRTLPDWNNLGECYERVDGQQDLAPPRRRMRAEWPWTRDRDMLDALQRQMAKGGEAISAAAYYDDPACTATLLTLCKDQDTDKRRRAFSALAIIGDSRVLPAAVAALNDPDQGVVAAATQALLELREAPDLSPLFTLLTEQNAMFRRVAATALALQRDPRAVEPLLTALPTEESVEVRKSLVLALGCTADARAVEPLLPLLKAPDEQVRADAAWALGAIGDTRAIDPLVAAIQDPASAVQVQAGLALARLKDKRGEETILAALKKHDPPVQYTAAYAALQLKLTKACDIGAELLQSKDPGTLYACAYFLAKMDDARVVPLIDTYLKNIADDPKQAAVRQFAVHGLGWVSDASACAPLARVMQTDENHAVRVEAAAGLATRGDAAAIDLLIATVQNPYLPERFTAVRALAQVKEPRVTPALVAALADPDPLLRELAARGLANQHDPRGATELVALLREPRETLAVALAMTDLGELKEKKALQPLLALALKGATEQRFRAIRTLGVLGDKSAVQVLITLLDDDLPRIRRAAATALGFLGQPQAVEELTNTLHDAASGVRQASARALGKIKARAAIDALIEQLTTEKATVVTTALADALHAITDQDLGTDATKWQAWRDKEKDKPVVD